MGISHLLSVHNIHDHTSLQHASKARLHGELCLALVGAIGRAISAVGGESGCHSACVVKHSFNVSLVRYELTFRGLLLGRFYKVNE